MRKIGIIGNRLVPFNEAYANQMRVLSEELNAQVITCNDLGWIPFRKTGRYFVVNTKFLMKKTPVLSFINGILFYIFLKSNERKSDVILLSAGIESEFLNYLNLKKCIPIVSSIFSVEDDRAKKFVDKIAPKLKGIIAQSERVKNQLINMGVDSDKIHFMYPVVDLNEFRYTELPSLNEFKILFASAPNVEDLNENNFEAKGVPLLLEAFKEFVESENARLYILWRGVHDKELHEKIRELKLGDEVEIINKAVNMPEWFAKTHITVIPYLNGWRSPEIPLSAVESLACGRPVVITDVAEIAELVQRYGLGVVCSPNKESIIAAFKECKKNYATYQPNCHKVVERLFKFDVEKVIKFLRLYGLGCFSHNTTPKYKRWLR